MICLDIETGGLSPTRSSILSIGAVDFDSDKEFYIECRNYPDRVIHKEALAVNGFTLEQATNVSKLFPNEAYAELYKWVLDNKLEPLLAGQNIGSFDAQFLKDAQSATTWPWIFGYKYVDLFSIGYARFRKILSMDQILEELGLPPEEKPHDALRGAKCTKAALKALFELETIVYDAPRA